MSAGQRVLSSAAARKAVNSVASRHTNSFGKRSILDVIGDPDEEDGEEPSDMGGELQLWKLLPQLRELPEALIRKLPLSAMFQLNSALAKERKTSDKLGVNTKLAHNAKKLARCPLSVQSGQDNRKEVLHPARFLGGASCSLAEQWSAARAVIGEEGITALGNYDLDSVGCGGSVTPKAWLEIHNPASQEMKLKLFHLPNVANSGLSSKKTEDEEESGSLREIADLESYKVALNTAREAMASALPWNRSVSAIMGLMVNTNYLAEDLGGNQKRAAVLTEFTDYVFGRNALNWENHQSFLSTDELTHVWSNWRTKRGITATPRSQEPRKKKEDSSSSSSSSNKKLIADVCRLFNAKACKQQADKECKSAWGRTLRHVCNKFLPAGKVCLKDHPRCDHV